MAATKKQLAKLTLREIRDDQITSIEEFAALTGLSISSVRRLIGERAIPIIRLSPRRIGITGRAYREFLQARMVEAVDAA
jgi:predicted DNA-binding transcriptional regulator AlpA